MKHLDNYINEMLLTTTAKEKFIKAVKKEFPHIGIKTIDNSYNLPPEFKNYKDIKQLQVTDNNQIMFYVNCTSKNEKDINFFFRTDILNDIRTNYKQFMCKCFKIKKFNGRHTKEYYNEHKDAGRLIYLGECYGYELTNITYGKRLEPYIAIKFSPVYQTHVTKQVYSETDILLHLTKTSNIEKIKKQGLLPNSKNDCFNYSERICLIERPEVIKHYDEFLDLISRLQYASDTKKMSLIFIDLHRCNNSFFIDLDNSDDYLSLYTKERIPAKAISLIINLENIDKDKLYYQISYCEENPKVLPIEEVIKSSEEIIKQSCKYL